MKGAKLFVWLVVAAVFLWGAFAFAAEAPKKGGAQKDCPIMGYPINKEQFKDYKGKRVYFCCTACPQEFDKDPDKYIKKLEDQGATLEKAPK